jgi:short-subunit dehydrogenase
MKKNIMITGATGALGTGAVSALSNEGNVRLILIARNEERLKSLKNTYENSTTPIEYVIADLSDPKSIENAVNDIRKRVTSIDALINIAALYKAKCELTTDGKEMMFATNHMAVFQLTYRLLDLIKASPNGKVITVTAPSSTKLNFDDLNGSTKFSSLSAFGASKMANLLFTFRLSRELENTQASACAFFPGLVKSNLMNEMPRIMSGLFKLIASSPEAASKALVALFHRDKNSLNGKFFNKKGAELKASPYAYDQSVQDKLFHVSDQILASVAQ